MPNDAPDSRIAQYIAMMTRQLDVSEEKAEKNAGLLSEFAQSEEGDATALHEANS